ncbi:MAG TPA: FkbM family methyltransferase [Rhodothermales bacterium]|nr:FkbM family methyltransferase [Rhodothermales bacterium]
MRALLVRFYRLLKPVLGLPLRKGVHAFRRHVLGDTSELGEATLARTLLDPAWPQWVVEVGANDGRTNANAYPFIRRGWNAVLIEPNPTMFARLQATMRRFPQARCVQAACSDTSGTLTLRLFDQDEAGMLSSLHSGPSRDGTTAVSEVAVRTEPLARLLDEHAVPKDFALLSVDAEGHDLQVLRGLDLTRYRPHLIITEHDPTTDTEKHALLEQHGYRPAESTQLNTIWRRVR